MKLHLIQTTPFLVGLFVMNFLIQVGCSRAFTTDSPEPVAGLGAPPVPVNGPANNPPAHPTGDRDFALSGKADLEKWYASELARGNLSSFGNRSIGMPKTYNRLPIKTAAGYQSTICSGAGCQLKIPFVFSQGHLQTVAVEMAAERANKNCTEDTAVCERTALARAVVVMEMIVHDEILAPMTSEQQEACSLAGTYQVRLQLTQDCVDQATNGTTYLAILAEENLIRFHQIIYPGRINIMIVQPHFFSQIRSRQGEIFRFDLYHRGSFGKAPYVTCVNCAQ